MTIHLKIENLSKAFGAFLALDRISLDIEEGDFVCFLGPSGCGKTTLLRAIAGLDQQSSGRIVQRQVDITPLDPTERDFGIVFQSYALFPNLTVAENIEFGLRNIGKTGAEARKRVSHLLNLVGIAEQAQKYPAQLSGGQQQRVALARALAIEPGLLLLDEPLSALDAQVRVSLRNELRALQKQVGVTTIMVTHDQEEALAVADRIVVMNEGRVEQFGTPMEIYRTPATPFVASFVGEMNFIDGNVQEEGTISTASQTLHFDRNTQSFRGGAAVTACVRPEDIMLLAARGGGANTLRGVIRRLDFLGPYFRVLVDVSGSGVMTVLAVASANVVDELQLTVGCDIFMAIAPSRLQIFPRFQARKVNGNV